MSGARLPGSSTATPAIHASAWVAQSAQLFGRISIAAGVSVWHNAVARAECQEIRVGQMTNVQDFVMLHVGFDEPTHIGDFCSITHHATIHGCRIGNDCLVGINAVIMDGVVVGEGSIVAGGAVLTEGNIFPPHAIIAGVPARQIGERDSARANRMNAWVYHYNAQAYRHGEHRAWDGPEFEAWRDAKRAEIETDADRESVVSGAERGRERGRV